MSYIVTGLDQAGQSCILSESAVGEIGSVLESAVIFETDQSPPPVRPTGSGVLLDIVAGPGLARWTVVRFPPGDNHPWHHTDSVDFDTVLTGSIDLGLHNSVRTLRAGDCVVINGVDHSWTAGPEGCTMAVLMLGSVPRGFSEAGPTRH
jgi:quercetin dioxygenase-like cupin family protein